MLRVVETYVSYQGEGPNTTRPTVFVRFAGCNFKCPGWPCDTQHAIDPKQFTKLQSFLSADQLADKVKGYGVQNICLTGGEVLLQNPEDLKEFLQLLQGYDIECFTNGSLSWDHIVNSVGTFILDWKLPGSGEEYTVTKETFVAKLKQMHGDDAIKFTIKDRNDYEVAKRRYEEYLEPIPYTHRPRVYAGVVWNAISTEQLCDWMMADKLDWNLNVQVHKYVWHPDKIGV